MRLRLGFALVVSALAVGCGDDSGGTSSSGSSSGTTGGTTGASVPGTTSTGEGTTAAVDSSGGSSSGGGSTSEASSSSTGMSATEGTTDDTGDSGSESSSGGGELNQDCIDGCTTEVMCDTRWATVDECAIACDANLHKAEAFSPFCRAAWEGVSACLGTLTCKEYAEWDSPTAFPYPCSDADVALEVECEGQ
ncbi:MAG: hypothetical protein AAF799_46070 [Myxococcota bacterium]